MRETHWKLGIQTSGVDIIYKIILSEAKKEKTQTAADTQAIANAES